MSQVVRFHVQIAETATASLLSDNMEQDRPTEEDKIAKEDTGPGDTKERVLDMIADVGAVSVTAGAVTATAAFVRLNLMEMLCKMSRR